MLGAVPARTPAAATFLCVVALGAAVGGSYAMVAKQDATGTPALYRRVAAWKQAMAREDLPEAEKFVDPKVSRNRDLLDDLRGLSHAMHEGMAQVADLRIQDDDEGEVDMVVVREMTSRSFRTTATETVLKLVWRKQSSEWFLSSVKESGSGG
jgi:hypothetical protein